MYKGESKMKKLLLTGIILLPTLAFAQSKVDTMIGSYGFKLALQPKPMKTDTIKAKIQRKVAKAQLDKKKAKQKPKQQNKNKPKK